MYGVFDILQEYQATRMANSKFNALVVILKDYL